MNLIPGLKALGRPLAIDPQHYLVDAAGLPLDCPLWPCHCRSSRSVFCTNAAV
ncbi:hypothetical protein [Synechococcus sp. MVIR-18-1]|uniref:hypothetical protein n=1 Tax=Synechococcus sp. MVIR-18-1 TaxID=1386941 RepID=UPI0016453D09|nr:hypothetical protein [Synechococcus sp. MVIR-18-1]QNI76127.1 hypothetical protein SynMVIR181_01147 [Synechococcus sp. MVIR-18-1]